MPVQLRHLRQLVRAVRCERVIETRPCAHLNCLADQRLEEVTLLLVRQRQRINVHLLVEIRHTPLQKIACGRPDIGKLEIVEHAGDGVIRLALLKPRLHREAHNPVAPEFKQHQRVRRVIPARLRLHHEPHIAQVGIVRGKPANIHLRRALVRVRPVRHAIERKTRLGHFHVRHQGKIIHPVAIQPRLGRTHAKRHQRQHDQHEPGRRAPGMASRPFPHRCGDHHRRLAPLLLKNGRTQA